MQLRVALVCLVLRNWIVGVLICIVYTDSDDVVSCGGDWLVLCCVEWMGFFNLNVTMHCLFSCSHNAHTHTHTQLLLLATVLVFHSLTAFVSSLPQVQTSHAALGPREDYLACPIFSMEGEGRAYLYAPTSLFRGGAESTPTTTIV